MNVEWLWTGYKAGQKAIFDWIYELALKFWLWLKGTAIDLWSEFVPWLFDQIPGEPGEYDPKGVVITPPTGWFIGIEGFLMHEAWTYIGDVAWIIPIGPATILIGATYTVCAVIRLVRWLLTMVPFVNMG